MIIVLRLDHRRDRDKRTSTHCGLASRALGADKIIYTGERDPQLLETIRDVTRRWGGPFRVAYEKNWRKVIKDARKRKYHIIHLTMYGIPYEKRLRTLKKRRNLLFIVGSEKVPHEVYDLADENVSVTSQPHSEVAALAVVLASLGKRARTAGARLAIIPQKRGKKVVERKKK